MSTIQDPVFVYFEDDANSRMIVKVLLTRVMHFEHLTIYEDSADVIAHLEQLSPQPNVFFIDIQMKPLDGYEILNTLRENGRYRDAKFIAMTANVMSHDVEQLKVAGFDGLIGKPILNDTFPQLIERILDGQTIWYIP